MSDIEFQSPDGYDDPEDAEPGETLLVDLRSPRRKLAGRLAIGSLQMHSLRLHWRHHGEETVFDLVAVARLQGFAVIVEPLAAAGAEDAGSSSQADAEGADSETESH